MLMEEMGPDLFDKLFLYLSSLTGNATQHVNKDVLASERLTGDINRALAYYQKGLQGFTADVT